MSNGIDMTRKEIDELVLSLSEEHQTGNISTAYFIKRLAQLGFKATDIDEQIRKYPHP